MDVNRRVQELLEQVVFPGRPATIHAVLQIVIERGGRPMMLAEVARRAGVRSRHSLYQALVKHDVPPLRGLALMVRVIRRFVVWELAQVALSRQALAEGRDQSQCSREVQRALGVAWTVARARGARWVAERLAQRWGTHGAA